MTHGKKVSGESAWPPYRSDKSQEYVDGLRAQVHDARATQNVRLLEKLNPQARGESRQFKPVSFQTAHLLAAS